MENAYVKKDILMIIKAIYAKNVQNFGNKFINVALF